MDNSSFDLVGSVDRIQFILFLGQYPTKQGNYRKEEKYIHRPEQEKTRP